MRARRLDGPGTHPFGARSVLRPSLVPGPRNAASWPIRARFQLLFSKVSQNGIVSQKCINKACHSPYFQNRVQKSPLDILRFPFLSAFSHKELMGHFDPGSGLIVKMTKCRPYVHPPCHARRGRQIPPVSRSKLLLGHFLI